VSSFPIIPLVIPASITDENAADFIEFVALDNLVYAEALGADDFEHSPEDELPGWRVPGRVSEGYIAKVDGRIVGAVVYGKQDDSPEAYAYITVAPDSRRRGIGSALLDHVIDRAHHDGRSTLQGHLFDPADRTGERMDAPGGTGSIGRANPGLAFALEKKAVLEQVGRISRLTLPMDPAAVLVADEQARRGYYGTYELLRWEGLTPDEFLDDIAVLMTRMSTDTPAAGLERTEDVWDAARVQAIEHEFASGPRRMLVVAAREIATGKLVAYTQLSVPIDTIRPVDQWATLVLTEHRGHRLGLALKLENLLYLEEVAPGHPSVTTVNASENRPMLAVNEAVGFAAIGYEGNVQLKLG
jgi:GNAT superfamily N-acetyltransferase